jgi:hypothetical protein
MVITALSTDIASRWVPPRRKFGAPVQPFWPAWERVGTSVTIPLASLFLPAAWPRATERDHA